MTHHLARQHYQRENRRMAWRMAGRFALIGIIVLGFYIAAMIGSLAQVT